MKRLYILLTFIIISFQGHAQVVLDSIQQIWKAEAKTSLVRINRTQEKADYMMYVTDYRKAVKMLKALGKKATSQRRWEDHHGEKDVVMWVMTFSEKEHLRFEYKPQKMETGGWIIYTLLNH